MHWNPFRPQIIGTVAINGFLSVWDAENQETQTSLLVDDSEPTDMQFANSSMLWTVDSQGAVNRFDLRKANPVETVFEVHRPLLKVCLTFQDTLSQIAVLPNNTNEVLLYDVRMPSKTAVKTIEF